MLFYEHVLHGRPHHQHKYNQSHYPCQEYLIRLDHKPCVYFISWSTLVETSCGIHSCVSPAAVVLWQMLTVLLYPELCLPCLDLLIQHSAVPVTPLGSSQAWFGSDFCRPCHTLENIVGEDKHQHQWKSLTVFRPHVGSGCSRFKLTL